MQTLLYLSIEALGDAGFFLGCLMLCGLTLLANGM